MSARIVDLVFGPDGPSRVRRLAGAVTSTTLVYFGVGGTAAFYAMNAPIPTPAPREIAVEMPAATPAPPPEKPPEVHHAPAPPPEHTDTAVETHEPPPPAQAGKLIASAPDANAPADLTGLTFVTGEAKAYAGGATTAGGTSTTAVHVTPDPRGKAGDRSKPVSLEADDWSCPWPREADREQIDEQTAVVRVVVASNGAVVSASVLEDPGFGFGQAAMSCARTTRFEPARDHDGRRISSISPPIRVRFTR